MARGKISRRHREAVDILLTSLPPRLTRRTSPGRLEAEQETCPMLFAAAALAAVWFIVIVALSVALAEQAADRRREVEYARHLSMKSKLIARRYGLRMR